MCMPVTLVLSPTDFEIVNPDLYPGYTGFPEAKLNVEFNIKVG